MDMDAVGNMIVSVERVSKSFAGVKALDSVSMDILAGKVHGLLGANGAGKSTIIKILAGVYSKDAGQIKVEGIPVQITSPRAASALGLSFIHQELNLVENFNAIENITMGLPKEKKLGLIDWKATGDKLDEVIKRVNFRQPLTVPVKDLSVADKWLIAIARALYQGAKMIAMDEPTASLSEAEVDMLIGVIHELTAKGIAVLFVSHRIDEVLRICDEITVFKDGKLVLHADTANMTKVQVINAIAGYEVHTLEAQETLPNWTKVLLKVEQVYDSKVVKGVSFELHEGEILGISGLVGAGRTELAKLIFGANKCVSGKMQFDAKPYAPRTPYEAVKNGIVLVPEERRSEGMINNKSVGFNLMLPNLHQIRSRFFLVNKRKGTALARGVIERLGIKTRGVSDQIMSLSGGNQQKVVIGKWLDCTPRLIIMDEPTRGVDVGARSEIYKLVRNMSKDGMSFLIISSDAEELPGFCDRVLVMGGGVVSGELVGDAITKDAILQLSYVNVG